VKAVAERVFVNGQFYDPHKVPFSVFDHGLLYGDGVFEGIRIISNGILLLQAHIDRLYESARHIGMSMPYAPEQMREHVLQTVGQSGLSDGYVRLVVTRGVGDLGINPARCKTPTVIIIASKLALYPEEFYRKGLDVHICQTRKPAASQMPGAAKTCNYMNNILAATEYVAANCQEGLLLTPDGFVSEATADNVFFIRGDTVFTPSLDTNCLPGITRAQVLRIAREQGFNTEEGRYLPSDFLCAEEVFLTGTGAGIIAARRINGQSIGSGCMGPKTERLRNAYEAAIPSLLTPVTTHGVFELVQ